MVVKERAGALRYEYTPIGFAGERAAECGRRLTGTGKQTPNENKGGRAEAVARKRETMVVVLKGVEQEAPNRERRSLCSANERYQTSAL